LLPRSAVPSIHIQSRSTEFVEELLNQSRRFDFWCPPVDTLKGRMARSSPFDWDELAHHDSDDFSAVLRRMEKIAGVADITLPRWRVDLKMTPHGVGRQFQSHWIRESYIGKFRYGLSSAVDRKLLLDSRNSLRRASGETLATSVASGMINKQMRLKSEPTKSL
jgi:hypothetical protein